MEEELKKQLRVKLIIAVVALVLIFLFHEITPTGNVIINSQIIDNCNYGGTTYDGSFIEILTPLDNSYVGKDNFNLTILSDFYGQDIIVKCTDEEETNCSLNINLTMHSLNIDGSINRTIEIPSFSVPKIDEGNKTYAYTLASSNENYTDGNFTINSSVKYNCLADNIETKKTIITVHKEQPTIMEIYPLNNLKLNITNSSTTTIVPKLNAADNLGILNRTIYDGNKTISLTENPSYNVTLSPGTYTWNFIATDLAGNIDNVTSQFTIFNSSSNTTTTNETEEVVSNATISFATTTTEDNKIINQSFIIIKVIANSTENSTNLTLKIFNSAGIAIYQNTTANKILETSYTFISDGIYFYNATLVYATNLIKTPTRKITIDTEQPTITIISPNKTTFTGSVIIDFTAQDDNGIAKKWINDGTKNMDFTSKLNKTLEEGSYTWTVYAQDNAGNIARETIKFSIITEETTSSTKKIAIIITIIVTVLLIIVLAIYLMNKKPKEPPLPNQSFGSLPPQNPPMQFNRPLPPRPMMPIIPSQTNPGMFNNNPYQR